MDTSKVDLRKSVLGYVESADDTLLQMMKALAERYRSDKSNETGIIPEWFYKILDKDRERHLKGETESYSWEEIKARLELQHDI